MFYFYKYCLNIFTPSSNYVCLGPNSLSSYIDTTEIAGLKQTPKWNHFLPLIGCTSQDKINVFQLTYLSLLSLLGERYWSSYLGLHINSVSKTRKNIYRSEEQVTFELCIHFRCLQVLYSKSNYINQVLSTYSVDFKAPCELWNPLGKAVPSKFRRSVRHSKHTTVYNCPNLQHCLYHFLWSVSLPLL